MMMSVMKNKFQICLFNAGNALPDQGAYQMIHTNAPDPSIVSVSFVYNGIGYIPTQTPAAYLDAKSVNRKAQ